LCEHPPLVTVGRHGSRAHILWEPDDPRGRRWRVRWVNRGGGCLLHLPGQLAVYPVLPLDRLGLTLADYLDRLHLALLDVLADFSLRGETRPGQPGVWLGGRPVACVGAAVCQWVTYYGAVLNVNPDLKPFRLVQCAGPGEEPMTSLERERRAPVRPSRVRERLLEHLAARFGFARTALFFDHPALARKVSTDALAAPR
jgi:lipoyl(octanoyl) transferase